MVSRRGFFKKSLKVAAAAPIIVGSIGSLSTPEQAVAEAFKPPQDASIQQVSIQQWSEIYRSGLITSVEWRKIAYG